MSTPCKLYVKVPTSTNFDDLSAALNIAGNNKAVIEIFQQGSCRVPVNAGDIDFHTLPSRVKAAVEINEVNVQGGAKIHPVISVVADDNAVAVVARLVDFSKIQNHYTSYINLE